MRVVDTPRHSSQAVEQGSTAAPTIDRFVGETARGRALARPPTRKRGGPRFIQGFPSALEALQANKGRAVLTTLGIVIGVAAVIAIVALGQGSSAQVTSQLAGLGTNVLTVRPSSTRFGGIRAGAGSSSSITVEDALAIQSGIHGIADLSPISEGATQVIAGNQNWRTDVQGVYAGYQYIQNWQVETGGFFTDADDQGARNVAVLGQTVAAHLFSSPTTAVGARGSDILAQFLTEAIVLSSIDGVIGIGLGVAIAYGAKLLAGWAILIPDWSIGLAFSFSAMVGSYPARKASRLDPIKALRDQ